MDVRPTFECDQAAFGIDALVTVPGGTAVETVAVWLPPVTVDVPAGEQFRRVEARHVIALSAADVPQLPRGTVIQAALVEGADVQTWSVDEIGRLYDDHFRATVVPGVLPT